MRRFLFLNTIELCPCVFNVFVVYWEGQRNCFEGTKLYAQQSCLLSEKQTAPQLLDLRRLGL
jgi:hypothetical protein